MRGLYVEPMTAFAVTAPMLIAMRLSCCRQSLLPCRAVPCRAVHVPCPGETCSARAPRNRLDRRASDSARHLRIERIRCVERFHENLEKGGTRAVHLSFARALGSTRACTLLVEPREKDLILACSEDLLRTRSVPSNHFVSPAE